jgi:hypothetical protein
MTATVARWATEDNHPLIDAYARFCRDLALSDRALRDRLRLARAFLVQHPDLEAWLHGRHEPAWPTCSGSKPGRWCRGRR